MQGRDRSHRPRSPVGPEAAWGPDHPVGYIPHLACGGLGPDILVRPFAATAMRPCQAMPPPTEPGLSARSPEEIARYRRKRPSISTTPPLAPASASGEAGEPAAAATRCAACRARCALTPRPRASEASGCGCPSSYGHARMPPWRKPTVLPLWTQRRSRGGFRPNVRPCQRASMTLFDLEYRPLPHSPACGQVFATSVRTS